jgi:hypothetical protein
MFLLLTGNIAGQWLSAEVLSLFLFHEMRPLALHEEIHIAKSLVSYSGSLQGLPENHLAAQLLGTGIACINNVCSDQTGSTVYKSRVCTHRSLSSVLLQQIIEQLLRSELIHVFQLTIILSPCFYVILLRVLKFHMCGAHCSNESSFIKTGCERKGEDSIINFRLVHLLGRKVVNSHK